MSKERVLALDELLPDNSTNYDSSPGVYIRSDKDRELDVLWQGFKINGKEERSPGFYLITGFIGGLICAGIMAFVINLSMPSKENISDLNLWKKANTTKPVVNVAPAATTEATSAVQSAEYTVKSGDTLGGIAYKFYGNSAPDKVQKIQDANNLNSPDDLQIDQVLTIPTEE
jgi:LysM repeat protein